MRGFGAVQVAFAHEAQMDKLAAAVGMDPIALRLRNAIAAGDRLPTGQAVPEPAPVAELLERVRDMPLPPEPDGPPDQRELPGGVANTTHGEGVRRGVGYAVGIKNVGFSEGFDDYSTARVRVSADADGPLVEVHTAAAEVGQGLITVQAQIARTELGIERVVVLRADTAVGSAGLDVGVAPDLRDRRRGQGGVRGGARRARRAAAPSRATRRARRRARRAAGRGDRRVAPPADVPARRARARATPTCSSPSRSTAPWSTSTPSSGSSASSSWRRRRRSAASMNPQALEGQIEGGSAQGLGLALMEEIVVRDGEVLNASFTDYLIPTTLDMPRVRIEVLEHADPTAPYGLKGVGEPPHISTPPAVVAAVRAATGRPLARIPVRPEHIV